MKVAPTPAPKHARAGGRQRSESDTDIESGETSARRLYGSAIGSICFLEGRDLMPHGLDYSLGMHIHARRRLGALIVRRLARRATLVYYHCMHAH